MNNSIKVLAQFLEHGEQFVCDYFMISHLELMEIIISLEKELKVSLISHSNLINIEPTSHCLKLLPYLQRSLEAIENGISSGLKKFNSHELTNELILGIASDSASTWAMNCIKDFNKRNPGLRITVLADEYITSTMISNATVIFWCLEEGELPEFKKHWYIEYKYYLFASEKYISKYGEPSIENVKNHKIIAYSGLDNNFDYRGSNWHISGNYALPKLQPTIYASSREMASRLVSEGAGIGSVCDPQDAYYKLGGLRKVLEYAEGPSIKSYFTSRKDLTEQINCNIGLIDILFKSYFEKNGVHVIECYSD
jgi:DNA-binding transcriptional LysR family regulator